MDLIETELEEIKSSDQFRLLFISISFLILGDFFYDPYFRQYMKQNEASKTSNEKVRCLKSRNKKRITKKKKKISR